MNVTREVIYDLLPGYFAGDVSAETRRLVEEFLRQDPEFAEMMERFRRVFKDRTEAPPSAADDRPAFERARAYLHKRSELRGYVVAFGLASFFVVAVPLIAGRQMPLQVLTIALAFAATSVIAGVQLFFLRDRRLS